MTNIPKRKSKGQKKVVRKEKSTPVLNDEPAEKLWAARGVEDVFFQREAQVTWWTVLGGIAVAALLTELDSLISAFKIGEWYFALYFLATCLVIVNSWVQTAWGSLVLKWPIWIVTSVSLFFQGLSLSVAALNITNPAIWYGAMSVVLFTALFNQLVFSKSRGWVTLSAELADQARTIIPIYAVLALFGAASSIYLGLRPSVGAAMIWGIVALVISIFALIRQHLGMTEEKQRMGIA